MTYPHPAIQALLGEYLVPVRLLLNRKEDQAHFRTYRALWTPTIMICDRRGASHYQSPGYLPPDLFGSMVRIGVARAMLAWLRYDEAAALLSAVADNQADQLAPEALYWLGVAWYLPSRQRAPLMRAWNRLRETYPTSTWSARIPPNQDDEIGG